MVAGVNARSGEDAGRSRSRCERQADTGRVALHGAAHKGRADVIQVLYDHGAKLDVRDYGNTDNRGGKLAIKKGQPVRLRRRLVRSGAVGHRAPGGRHLLRKLMTRTGPAGTQMGRTLSRSVLPRRGE